MHWTGLLAGRDDNARLDSSVPFHAVPSIVNIFPTNPLCLSNSLHTLNFSSPSTFLPLPLPRFNPPPPPPLKNPLTYFPTSNPQPLPITAQNTLSNPLPSASNRLATSWFDCRYLRLICSRDMGAVGFARSGLVRAPGGWSEGRRLTCRLMMFADGGGGGDGRSREL